MTNIPDILLPTTVVGSYPPAGKKGLGSLIDPMRPAVKRAVDDQLEAGIDIISDGQVRGDMIVSFTRRLPGVRGHDVIGKVMPPSGTISVADTKYALSKARYVKGIITGPSTLSHALHISTPMYRKREELTIDLAQAFSGEAVTLEEAGVCMVQLDEPILSTGAADLGIAKEAISRITSRLKIPSCLHVCGDLSGVIDEILSLPVHILDFEFANNPNNLEILGEKDLMGRKLGFGCLDSTDSHVEDVETVKRRIRAGIDTFGAENLLLDPDCGLRMLPRDAARGKLAHLVSAAKEVREELK
ncbi:MAG: methionine synthase [Methanoregulaceae archaeon]|nr:methionine synthase [Methanoregulaceae archaeon]MDD5049254.1 methionine synthase [Methanoregulaceae archaeon]MDD5685918.1 methionine synthase [Methanoregulaceae archaeon]